MAQPKQSKQLNWFGVKTVFRTAAVGKPKATDAAYDSSISLIEKRVVLFRAKDLHEAIRLVEREARAYARDRRVNPCGQPVVTRHLGACDAFEFSEPPKVGTEMFSTTEVVSRKVSDKAVLSQRIGHVETACEMKRRRNILNCEFSGTAKRRI